MNLNVKKRALLVGINHYAKAPLRGCIGDAQKMHTVLSKHEDGAPNFDCKLLISKEQTNRPITTSKLKEYLLKLFDNEADIALFYFSGHGASNASGNYLVTQDASKFNEGVSLDDIIVMANRSKTKEVVIILDACHSGHMGNMRALSPRTTQLREGVSVLSSSRDTQYSVERNGAGLFTTLIHDALLGGAADITGSIHISRVYSYADQLLSAWEQRPLFKSHLAQMISLRNVSPKIPLRSLRTLPMLFDNKDALFTLDPSYEESIVPKNAKHEEVMTMLRSMYINGLLIPDQAASMYHAAKENAACRLTPLGQFYWDLADKNRI